MSLHIGFRAFFTKYTKHLKFGVLSCLCGYCSVLLLYAILSLSDGREATGWSPLPMETSEECPPPNDMKYVLRGLAAQGIISRISGIVIGKPMNEKYYDEYKQVLLRVIGMENERSDLPILYNVNFGHTAPICILPYGVMAEIDCICNSLRLLEPAVI